jgi:hypothetical protein
MKNVQVTWAEFNRTYQAKGRQAAAKLLPRMKGADYEAARRFIHGPTAAQRRESAERQRAIANVTETEIRRHCQFGGLPGLGRCAK